MIIEPVAPETLSLENILSSKRYVKEGGGITYKSAKELFEPFIDRVSKLSPTFHVRTSDPKSIGETDDVIETSYGKALIEAQIALSPTEVSTIGIVYSLTSNTPIIKAYYGPKVTACLNLCIWNAENVYQSSILGSISSVYKQIDDYIAKLEENNAAYFELKARMQKAILSKAEYHQKLGSFLDRSAGAGSVLGTSPIVNAAKLIKSGKHYSMKEGEISEWTMCNAITDCLKNDMSLDKVPNKTLKAFELFAINEEV